MQAFQGVSVVDISQGIAGPVAASILARQGAAVIKVEPPRGDWIRQIGGQVDGMTANAIAGNLGKRSLAIDATKPEGRAAVQKLARDADVLIENFRPGVMQRLGLDYGTLAATNPRLIYCSITGFGASGPWAGKAGTDSIAQAFSGMVMANSGGGAPRRIGLYVPDNITGIYAAQAISAALYARVATGPEQSRGRRLDISLAQSCAAFQAAPIAESQLFPDAAARQAPAVPSGEFKTRDGWIVAACLDDAMFHRFSKALGRDQWITDARYATGDERKARAAEVAAMVIDMFSTDTSSAWLAKLEAADVLCSPVNDYAALRAHPQSLHMETFSDLEQAPYGALSLPRLPAAMDDFIAAPRLGEHSRAILAEAGYAAAEIDDLVAKGVVRAEDK